MRKGGGKGKGNAFESQNSKRLSLWLTDDEDKTQLIPTRQSGGWSESKGGGSWRQLGDIAPNGPAGDIFRRHFVIECKHHKEIDFWHYWTCQPGENLMGWWAKLNEEIEVAREELEGNLPAPMLIFRANYKPLMVAVPPRVLPRAFPQLHYPSANMGILLMDDLLTMSPQELYNNVSAAWDDDFSLE